MNNKVVSFRQGKKRVSRAKSEAIADENRIKFGRTKAQKLAHVAATSKLAGHVDGHKITPDDIKR